MSAGEKPATYANILLMIRIVGNMASEPKVIVIFFEISLNENRIKFFLLSFDAMVAFIFLNKASDCRNALMVEIRHARQP